MAGDKDAVMIRKRALIARANRVMFLWVAGISVVVGFAGVASWFLLQQFMFNQKVLSEKSNTISTLNHNLEVIGNVETEVRMLNSNEDLMAARALNTDDAVRVILDALPSEPNALALGNSLQNRLLAGIDGLTIESLQVDPINTVTDEYADDGSAGVAETDAAAGEGSTEFTNVITLRFTVVGTSTALQQLLQQLERSIRVVDITTLTIESRGSQQALTAEARAFYEPARVLELRKTTVQP